MEHSAAMLLDLLQHLQGVKATHEDDRRSGAEIRVHRVNVKKRQHEQQDVGLLSAATWHPVPLLAVGDEVPVRQHRTFRSPRRAGGVTNRGNVTGRYLDSGKRSGAEASVSSSHEVVSLGATSPTHNHAGDSYP